MVAHAMPEEESKKANNGPLEGPIQKGPEEALFLAVYDFI